MKFFNNLYVSESLEKKRDKIINKLASGRYPLTVYILALIEEGENQLEFYSTVLFKQKLISDTGIFVVGIASDYDDAVYLVKKIVEDVYKETGGLDIRSYIRERQSQDN